MGLGPGLSKCQATQGLEWKDLANSEKEKGSAPGEAENQPERGSCEVGSGSSALGVEGCGVFVLLGTRHLEVLIPIILFNPQDGLHLYEVVLFFFPSSTGEELRLRDSGCKKVWYGIFRVVSVTIGLRQ